MRITGTFIDEVSHDILSWNWGEEDWDKDFAAMKSIGIDTVVVIRCGSERWTMYPSAVLEKHENAWRPPLDLLELYLRLAEKYDMKLYVGTYHSNRDWLSAAYDVQAEVDLMKQVCDEIWQNYGKSKAFGGWYLSQEITGRESFNVVECFRQVGAHCKGMSGLPTFISPGIRGSNIGTGNAALRRKNAVTPEEHYADWDWIMGEITSSVDSICFQSGHVLIDDMLPFMKINHKLSKKHGLNSWTNIESFGIHRKGTTGLFPLRWQELLMKLEFAEEAGFEKVITFEFSHFMSPNSLFTSAQNLYKRYCEHFEIQI